VRGVTLKSAYAVRRPVENAYLVRERDRRRLRELVLVLATVGPLLLALLAYTWIHLEVLRTGYRIDAEERRLRQLVQSERQLRLEASYLGSPERTAERAASDLGMQAPVLGQMLFAAEIRSAGPGERGSVSAHGDRDGGSPQ
jgi:hypothetical protein